MDPERMSLNKWEMHKALQDLDIAMVHLPDTCVATVEKLSWMLDRYKAVYVKPVGTWGGRQITRILKQNNLYLWQEQGNDPLLLHSEFSLWEQFRKTYENTFCIAQAAAPIRYLKGRPFDLRLLMQRNTDDAWVAAGTVVRVGGKGSIVSNIEISSGEVMDVPALCQRFKLSRVFCQRLEKRLQESGYAICSVLGKYRHFNEVGIDFGLGIDNSLWILEVNTDDTVGAPSHELFAKLPDKKLFREIEARTIAARENMVRIFLEQIFDE
jgi:hypothetical protein